MISDNIMYDFYSQVVVTSSNIKSCLFVGNFITLNSSYCEVNGWHFSCLVRDGDVIQLPCGVQNPPYTYFRKGYDKIIVHGVNYESILV